MLTNGEHEGLTVGSSGCLVDNLLVPPSLCKFNFILYPDAAMDTSDDIGNGGLVASDGAPATNHLSCVYGRNSLKQMTPTTSFQPTTLTTNLTVDSAISTKAPTLYAAVVPAVAAPLINFPKRESLLKKNTGGDIIDVLAMTPQTTIYKQKNNVLITPSPTRKIAEAEPRRT